MFNVNEIVQNRMKVALWCDRIQSAGTAAECEIVADRLKLSERKQRLFTQRKSKSKAPCQADPSNRQTSNKLQDTHSHLRCSRFRNGAPLKNSLSFAKGTAHK